MSNTTGTIDFYEVESLKYNSLKHNLSGEGNAGSKTTSRNFIKNTVNSKPLIDVINEHQISSIDLIKLDTEGTEMDILNSSEELIKRFEPIVICETLYNIIESDLETYFKNLDYLFFNHTSKGLIQTSSIKRSTDDGIRNCFFVPKSKSDLINRFVVKS